ncbi:hypothetical protein [Paenibacillus phytohabitans]|uniref:hypothetical protein n=1 Tax=Paenibacillus phytohabitans TaxID=2654978 RepID=UPI00300B26CE
MNLNYFKNKFSFLVFFIFSLILLTVSLVKPPVLTGDGKEYLSMSISFNNHFSFDLQLQDIQEKNLVQQKNNISTPEELDHAGFFQALNGNWYSYHFWFYSLVNVPVYNILHILHLNELASFQITNSILLIFLMLKLIKSKLFKDFDKSLLILISIVGPVLFYLNWTHPELFSYTFLFLAVLYFLERNYKGSMLFISLASLQNPAISVIALSLLLYELFQMKFRIFNNKKIFIDFLVLGMISSINIIPYIFYYVYFGKFSLISSTGFSSLDLISFNKVWSLFFDLNFGLVIYVPVLLFLFLYACIKLEKLALITFIILIMISLVNATQLNWNSGMMYINRYAVWYIPLLILGLLPLVRNLSNKGKVILAISYLLTTGLVTGYFLKQGDFGNYTKFGPVAKWVINNVPVLYNPNPEIFIERAEGQDGIKNISLPITVLNSKGDIRKILSAVKGDNAQYKNSAIKMAVQNDIFIEENYTGGEDIFLTDSIAAFGKGWYPLEKANGSMNFRWINSQAVLFLWGIEELQISFDIMSFNKSRNVSIFVNDKLLFKGDIVPDKDTKVDFTTTLKGYNIIKIISNGGSNRPSDFGDSPDNRDLSFNIKNFKVE